MKPACHAGRGLNGTKPLALIASEILTAALATSSITSKIRRILCLIQRRSPAQNGSKIKKQLRVTNCGIMCGASRDWLKTAASESPTYRPSFRLIWCGPSYHVPATPVIWYSIRFAVAAQQALLPPREGGVLLALRKTRSSTPLPKTDSVWLVSRAYRIVKLVCRVARTICDKIQRKQHLRLVEFRLSSLATGPRSRTRPSQEQLVWLIHNHRR